MSLEAEAEFVRRLAAALARDADFADDVAQDAMLAALVRGPDARTSLRGWLAATVRNVVSKHRR
ncbi:MAG TPA: sigma factor, partial [Planctomycetota bacterium]|nr:sigma factor [Planctomycetota bacterium]